MWKAVCATRLVLDPESLSKLIALFFVHHVYVWCRAFVMILETVEIFEEVTCESIAQLRHDTVHDVVSSGMMNDLLTSRTSLPHGP